MRHQTPSRRPHPIVLLLLVPLVAVLVPEIYNRASPAIGGMPFSTGDIYHIGGGMQMHRL